MREGRISQKAMSNLVKIGTAMGAKDFIPIISAHTAFSTMEAVAYAFLPRGVPITKEGVARFSKECISYAARPIPKSNTEEAIKPILNLEEVDDINQVIHLFTWKLDEEVVCMSKHK